MRRCFAVWLPLPQLQRGEGVFVHARPCSGLQLVEDSGITVDYGAPTTPQNEDATYFIFFKFHSQQQSSHRFVMATTNS